MDRNLNYFYGEVNLVYGDGGAYPQIPRIACYSHDNIKHILNGIGEVNGDKILVLSKDMINIYTLPNL